MNAPFTGWLNQINQLAADSSLNHIDVLVDQAGCSLPILTALPSMQPAMPWFSLFSGLPEESMLEQAPLLMRINLTEWRHKHWLGELVEHLGPQSRLVLLLSPLPFDVLAKNLQGLSQAEWGGQNGLLRYYDPRILPYLLNDVLGTEQNLPFLRVALFWSWLDLDQQPVWLPGTYQSGAPLPQSPSPIALSDAQYFLLGSISDAHQLLGVAAEQMPDCTREQRFAACYRLVLKATDEHYYGDLAEYASRHLEVPETVARG